MPDKSCALTKQVIGFLLLSTFPAYSITDVDHDEEEKLKL
jgi:hypothetical protein